MGIEVPSSSPITVAAELIDDQYFQKFIITDADGVAIGDSTSPMVVQIAVTGYASTPATYQGTAIPAGGVHIADVSNVDFSELSNGQLATMRLNNRRALFTVNDGQATLLTSATTANYHDTMVTSGEFTPMGTLVAPYAGFFQYATNSDTRYLYIPMSRSGWSRASVLVKHDLVDSTSGAPVNLTCNLYGDFGQFDDDILLSSVVASGQVSVSVSKVFTCYETPVPNTLETYVPALNSPLAGVILAVSPSSSATGSYSVYVSKSA